MDDLFSLCIFGFIVIIGLFIVMNMMRGMGGRGGNYPEQGYTPEYDDPDIESQGGFGRNRRGGGFPGFGGFGGGSRSGGFGGNETPKGGSRSGGFGGFGGSKGSKGGFGGGSRRADSPNVQSRGGFGRNKK